MKLQKLFTGAIILLAVVAANFQTASAQKKTLPKANRNWVVFTSYQTVEVERSPVAANYTCESSGIYATANFAAPIDLSGGFYVTIASEGKIVIQEKMTVDGNPGARRSIPVDIIPDDDANLGFPEASLDYSHALLTELKAGVHNVTVAVSVGEGDDEQIASGSFTFDNRRGCEQRYARVDRLVNGAATGEAETAEAENAEPAEDDTDVPAVPARPQAQPAKPQQDNGNNYVDFFNNCSERELFTYEYPDGTTSSVFVEPGFPSTNQYPVGTKFWLGSMRSGEPFYVMPKSQYSAEMDKARTADKVNFCR